MKVHVFSTSTAFTGGRQVMFGHADALGRRGHDVTVWVTAEHPRLDWMDLTVPLVGWANRPWHELPRADVVLFDRARLARPLWRARRGAPVHFCQGFEGTDAEGRVAAGGWLRPRERWRQWRKGREIDRAYRLPTVKLVVHPHLRDLISRRFRQPAFLVPNGLPPGVFTPPEGRDWRGQTVLVVGPTDTGWKRVGDALEAVRRLKQTRPGLRLVRAAQHPMREPERQRGITDEYHTLVPPTAMAELYRRADVAALASDATEGFGLPALEAMACGTPLVLTDTPAFRGFARPDNYAHFVPVGRPDRLAFAIGRLLDDAAERRRLSRRGVEVAAGYTLARSHQAMEDALRQVLVYGGARRLAG